VRKRQAPSRASLNMGGPATVPALPAPIPIAWAKEDVTALRGIASGPSSMAVQHVIYRQQLDWPWVLSIGAIDAA
jgi:hypothetical protein